MSSTTGISHSGPTATDGGSSNWMTAMTITTAATAGTCLQYREPRLPR